MECLQIIVEIESNDLVLVLKQKGQELGHLLSVHGNYAVFAGESTFSWKWVASNLSFMDDWNDAECIEYTMDNNYIVAALWQCDDGVTKWYACNGCSDDLITDDVKVNKVLALVNVAKVATSAPVASVAPVALVAPVASVGVSVPSRELITRNWLMSLTPQQWDVLIRNNQISYKILDEWENPIFKNLQAQYKGLSYEFPQLALKALKEGKGWAEVEAIKAKPTPKAKPKVLLKK